MQETNLGIICVFLRGHFKAQLLVDQLAVLSGCWCLSLFRTIETGQNHQF